MLGSVPLRRCVLAGLVPGVASRHIALPMLAGFVLGVALWTGSARGSDVGEFDRLYPSSYAPGVSESSDASRIETKPGDEQGGVDIELMASGGAVSGEVRGAREMGSIPLSGVLVEAQVGSIRASTYTRNDGSFLLPALPAGSVLLRYSTDDATSGGREHRALFHGLSEDSTSALRIVNVNGQTTDVDPVVLPPAARLLGQVREANGSPRDDVLLRLLDSQGNVIAAHPPSSDGGFRFGGLAEGMYAVQAVPDSASGLLPEFAGGSRDFMSADVFVCAAGVDTETPAIELDAGGTLIGQIRTEGTTIGIPFTELVLSERNGDREYRTRTGSLGFYRIVGLPASSYVLYSPGLRRYWPDQVREEDARPITVTENGLHEANMDGSLLADCELPPAVQGYIVGNIDADAARFESALLRAWSETDTVDLVIEEPGFYTLECLPPGDYYVGLFPQGRLLPQFYPEAAEISEALLVTVDADSAEGVDFEPVEGISVGGMVSAFETGPVAGARVSLLDSDLRWVAETQTGEDGTYLLDRVADGFGIAAGIHVVRVDTLRVPGPVATPVLSAWIEAEWTGEGVEITASLPRVDDGSLSISRRGSSQVQVVHQSSWELAPHSPGSGDHFEYVWVDHSPESGSWTYELDVWFGGRRLFAESPVVVGDSGSSHHLSVRPVPWDRTLPLDVIHRSSSAAVGEGQRLVLYDVTGRERAHHVFAVPGTSPRVDDDAEEVSAGRTGHVEWHPRDLRGRELPGGVYYLEWLDAEGSLLARSRLVIRP